MQIVNDEQIVGTDLVHLQEIGGHFPERSQGVVVLQIPDVRTDVRLPVDYEGEAVLQVAANGQDGSAGGELGNRGGCKAPRSAQDDGTPLSDADDGVVEPAGDRTFPGEKRIREAFGTDARRGPLLRLPPWHTGSSGAIALHCQLRVRDQRKSGMRSPP